MCALSDAAQLNHKTESRIPFMNVAEALEEEMDRFLKEVYQDVNKQWKIKKYTVQDLKVEIDSINKSKSEDNLKVKNLGTLTGTTEVSFIKRL